MESANKRPPTITYSRVLVSSIALMASLLAGCVSEADPNPAPANSGAGGVQNAPGDTPVPKLDCTVPEPGCLCDDEGQHMPCGKVTVELNGQMSCGKGVSVCTGGKWDECIITNIDPLPEGEAPPGYYRAQAQTPTPCDNNPCNPYCYDFPGSPDGGIADSGTDVVVVDGGIGTVWDAGAGPCTPLTKAQACVNKDCGEVSNGCTGTICCGSSCVANGVETCPNVGEICGGNGVPNKCGKPPIPGCTPKTQAQACTNGKNCGWEPNGCGGVVACGALNGLCAAGNTCGLGGVNICGPNCVPKTCNQLGKNCGLFGDGCGNTLNCGTCAPGQFCGAFSANVCWAPGNCTPKTLAQACAQAGKNCGEVANGCGGVIDCGNCGPTQLCGGGGVPNVCGGNVCVPKTFAQACTNAGKNCGPISDGCGGLVDCGTCQSPASCGGGGVPNKCGTPANCTNLCLKQVFCPQANQTTSITGKVYAPNGVDPLPNVVVYVPNAPVPAFPNGITCENCAQAGGSPLVSTKTATDGSFTINNMPAGSNIPLVIQIGRWRRQITIPTVTACANTPIAPALTRLPRTKAEGDIPRIAVSTGCVDRMECVLRRLGVADSEFTNPGGGGRINFYKGGYCQGSYISNNNSTPWESSLVGSLATLDDYDMVLFPCQANEYYYTGGAHVAYQNNIANYVNAGGRAFMTHYNYHWLLRRTPTWNSPLFSAINWTPSQWFSNGTLQGTINTGFARGKQLADWLQLPQINGSVGYGQVLVDVTRKDFSGWDANNTTNWLTLNNPAYPIHLTFDTPLNVAQANKCGRVVFSDFHVYNGGGTIAFPNECPNTAMTPQEKLLEYMIFDLSSCVGSSPPPPPCQKQTCASQGVTCGQAGDGCGGTLNCGPACPVPTCTPITCASQGLNCGQIGDGCGGVLDCGLCPANQVCGGVNNQTPNKCGDVSCVKNACATGPGVYCGPFPHGCNATPPNFLITLDRSCSMTNKVGGVTQWKIAVDAINKMTTDYNSKMQFGLTMFPDKVGANCAQDGPIPIPVAAGNEAAIQNLLTAALNTGNANYPNGPCVTNIDTAMTQAAGHAPLKDATRKNFVLLLTDGEQACGNKAAADALTLSTIQSLKAQGIGTFVLGFGSGVDVAALNSFAVAGGYPNPDPTVDYYKAENATELDAALKLIADQAIAIQCECTEPGETCGGGGIPMKCGKPCGKQACPSGLGAFCGTMPDGCGGTVQCGCTAPETCGGSGVIAKCGKPVCNPKTCVDQGIECGQAGDGCGNILNCGTCPAPLTCGGSGVPGKCGFVKVHSDGYFTRDYAANCPSGTAPYWQLWSWTAVTPGDSYIDFTVQTSDTEAGLAAAPSDALRFSQPPGPAGLVSQIIKAKQPATPPAWASDTQVGSASIDNTLVLNGRKRNSNYLRVTSHIAPRSDKTDTALLKLWDVQVDCLPTE